MFQVISTLALIKLGLNTSLDNGGRPKNMILAMKSIVTRAICLVDFLEILTTIKVRVATLLCSNLESQTMSMRSLWEEVISSSL